MRTQFILVFVVAFAVASMVLTMSGVNGIFGQTGQADLEGDLNQTANESSASDGSFAGDARSQGSIVGFVISGAQSVGKALGMIVGLPYTLMSFGFPKYFAWPIGMAGYIFASIGFVQFITGRVFR